MKTLFSLVSRHCKLYFKDKGVFLPSLIAPLILLFLFIAFLGNVYRDSIRSVLGAFSALVSDGFIEGVAAGWLISSLLAVSAVTIAFSANVVMVQDKADGQAKDIFVSPVPRAIVSVSYFVSTFLVTSLICLVAIAGGFVYIAIAGWHLTFADVLLCILDTLLLVLFGTSLSSIVCHFLHSQGGIAAVETTVSAAYGFLCGAYMPLGNLTAWLRNALMFLPGTYGTGLLHEHLMGAAIESAADSGVPSELIAGMKEGFDCNLSFFGTAVPAWASYLVLLCSIFLLVGIYVLLCTVKFRKKGNVQTR